MHRLILSAPLLLGMVAQTPAAPVEIVVHDKKTGQPVPCRIHLKDSGGKAQRPLGLPFWFDHFVCPGQVNLELDAGKYALNGYWTQDIYYPVLNTGLRLPPSAGSASGVLPNPVGYNRVYVQSGRDMDHGKWWEGLRAGRSFVTNGPLLRAQANGKFPGHVFTADAGQQIKVDLKADLTSRDPVRFLEIIKNGQVERKVAIQDLSKSRSLGDLVFKESGWFLVRAIADNKETFRFASTAPFFVEVGPDKRRISKTSAQFFLDWARERKERIKLDDPAQRTEVLAHHLRAEKFWLERLANANAK